MTYNTPTNPKIYHILHADRLPMIVADGSLWSDSIMTGRAGTGTPIGMNKIKQRRLNELKFTCYPDLYVGQCVPFYFCPRSIMLYMMFKGNHMELTYQGGQQPIIHLEADLGEVVRWADCNNKRWVFTLSNAGSYYFEDRNNLNQLSEINWPAVTAHDWQQQPEAKQAEFLIEESFPFKLIKRIGVYSLDVQKQLNAILAGQLHSPSIEVMRDWYY